MSSFRVQFRDYETMEVDDIIAFEKDQVAEIKCIAEKFTKVYIRKTSKEGIDLSYLTDSQKQHIIGTKDRFFKGKTDTVLLNDETVRFTWHSSERNLERVDSSEASGLVYLISELRKADTVIKAQFKGYPTLSYTTTGQNDPDAYKLPISFAKKQNGNRTIVIITVVPKSKSQPETMETSLEETNPGMLEKLKQRLKKN